MKDDNVRFCGQSPKHAARIINAFNIRIRELNDEEKNASEIKEENISDEENGRDSKINMQSILQYSYIRHTNQEVIKDLRKPHLR